MLTAIISFFTGTVIPFAAKYLQSKQDNKQILALKDNDNAKEIQLAQINLELQEVELAKLGNQVALGINSGQSGWIRTAVDIVRLAFGAVAVYILIHSTLLIALGLPLGHVILAQTEISCAFFSILGFYIGERSVKKAWGK